MEGEEDKSSKPGISFTFQKRTKSTKLKPVESAETKEFLYSLEGEHIERYRYLATTAQTGLRPTSE